MTSYWFNVQKRAYFKQLFCAKVNGWSISQAFRDTWEDYVLLVASLLCGVMMGTGASYFCSVELEAFVVIYINTI
jgi:hypothetical protein